MRIVFMGTPAYAVPSLWVAGQMASDLLVVSRPDAPAGRGHQLRPSAVKREAREHGWPVLTPHRLDQAALMELEAFGPDVIVTAAYGLILPAPVLDLPRWGAYNLHASLLPRWRGPNPIAWAIRSGDRTTGVTLMRMDAGVDTGPVVAQALVGISEADTTGSLTSRLAEEAARLLAQHLPRLGSQPVPVKAQEGSPTHAPRFRPGEEQLDFSQPARILWAKIRSMLPEPGPYTTVNGIRIKILVSQLVADTIPCGDIRRQGETWVIGCAEQSLRIITIKPAGRSPMTPGAYLRGLRTTPPTHVD